MRGQYISRMTVRLRILNTTVSGTYSRDQWRVIIILRIATRQELWIRILIPITVRIHWLEDEVAHPHLNHEWDPLSLRLAVHLVVLSQHVKTKVQR